MAKKNRSEVNAIIQALTAIVGETEFKEAVGDDLAGNAKYRKDVAGTQTAASGSVTVDFTNYDQIVLNAAFQDLSITLAGIENGDIVTLKVWNKTNKTISFVNALNLRMIASSITVESSVYFQLISKGGTIYALPLLANYGGLNQKVIEIGDWNMDASQFVVVAHGLAANFKKIRMIDVIIRDDTDTDYYPLCRINNLTGTTPDGAVSFIASGGINLMRVSGGDFDDPAFDSTSYNRGWITIFYES